MPRPTSFPTRLLALACCALAISCSKDDPTAPVSGDKPGTGRLFLSKGKPAAYATVRIFRVDEIPAGPAAAKRSAASLVTRTDAEGRYFADTLSEGEYNIMASLDGEYAYQDSLALGDGSGPIPPDTLDSPGVLKGFIAVQPQHDPRTVTVQLLGTNRFTNLDSDGGFEFRDLGAGSYTARLVTTEPGYTNTYTALKVAAGSESTLKDTLRLVYTGVPIISGITVAYDTLHGIATLRWNRSHYANLLDYLVYRDPAYASDFAGQPLSTSRDTVFMDTLISSPATDPFAFTRAPFRLEDMTVHALEYRVRLRSRTGEMGPLFHASPVDAVSPLWVTTTMEVKAPGIAANTVTVRDSTPVIVTFKNPTRHIRSVRWLYEEGATPFRETRFDAKEGADTIIHVSGSSPGVSSILVRIVDEAGTVWKGDIAVRTVDDIPRASILAAPTVIRVGDSVRVSTKATDLGRIARKEWAFGPDGAFVDSKSSDTVLYFGSVPPGGLRYPVMFRVTDDDGHMETARVEIPVFPWKQLPPLPSPRWQHASVELGGKIYVMGGYERYFNAGSNPLQTVSWTRVTTRVDVYDIATDKWSMAPSMLHFHRNFSAAVVDGKIVAMGGKSGENYANEAESFDPATGRWTEISSMPTRKEAFSLVKSGGRMYALEGLGRPNSPTSPIVAYDTLEGAWITIPVSIPAALGNGSRTSLMSIASGDTVYTFGGFDYRDVVAFDFAKGTATKGGSYPFSVSHQAWTRMGDRILAAGGVQWNSGQTDGSLVAYDLAKATSKTLAMAPPDLMEAAMVTYGGKVYLIGGRPADGEPSNILQVYAFPIDSMEVLP